MRVSNCINLANSLRLLFKDSERQSARIEDDAQRQRATANEILRLFFSPVPADRREIVLLADEVGLGKTYVALAVVVSILDAIRKGEQPEDLPAQKPVALVLTPDSDALYEKWRHEAETFKKECAIGEGLGRLQLASPRESVQSGNAIDLTNSIRQAKKREPVLLIAKNLSHEVCLCCLTIMELRFDAFNSCSFCRLDGGRSMTHLPIRARLRLNEYSRCACYAAVGIITSPDIRSVSSRERERLPAGQHSQQPKGDDQER
jgi:hypothetical protein